MNGMTAEEDKLNAFCKVLRDAMEEIKRIVLKNPDKNTEYVMSIVNLALYMTE